MSTEPRRRRTQAERSAATQALLLEATIDCIVELGWTGASTNAICDRAAVSRGALLHHYPTKAALVAAAIERLFEQRHREFRDFLSGRPGLKTALSRLWRIYTGKTFYAWAELLTASRTDEDLRAELRAVDDRFFAEAQRTCTRLLGLEERPDAEVAALTRLIFSVLDGLALNHVLGGRDQVARATLAALQQAITTLRPQPS